MPAPGHSSEARMVHQQSPPYGTPTMCGFSCDSLSKLEIWICAHSLAVWKVELISIVKKKKPNCHCPCYLHHAC